MRRFPLRVLLATTALLLAALAPAEAGGEVSARVPILADDPDGGGPAIRATALRGPLSPSGGGWGFFRIDLENEDGKPHAVTTQVMVDSEVAATRVVTVPAGGRLRTWMPCPPAPHRSVPAYLHVSAARGPAQTMWLPRENAAWDVALVVRDAGAADELQTALPPAVGGPRTHAKTFAFVPVDAADLPPTWTWLTGAAAVVLDAGSPGLEDAARQRVLLDYVEAGGYLIVLDATALPKGPLAEALGSAVTLGHGRRGLGGWTARAEPRLGSRAARAIVARWSGTPPDDGVLDVTRLPLEVVPDALRARMEIPGLGRVPVRAFFFLLLGFAILVGPVAYFFLRRRRRLTLMTVVVPALGIGFAGAILLYGLLSEGLGTRGSLRSFSYLDQRSHEAVSTANRTLYAGWGPGSLRISPDTVLSVSPDPDGASTFRRRGRVTDARIRLDVDGGRLDGSILPSRTVTGFATTTRGKARDRLRFRHRSDGRYEVLAGEGFTPDFAAGPVLLRDAEGRYHVGTSAAAPLAEADATDVPRLVGDALGAWSAYEAARDVEDPIEREPFGFHFRSGPADPGDGRAPLRAWLTRRVEAEIPAGSYVAWMRRAPVFDDLGLDVDWKDEHHLVFGRLAPDDVEEERR